MSQNLRKSLKDKRVKLKILSITEISRSPKTSIDLLIYNEPKFNRLTKVQLLDEYLETLSSSSIL